MKLNSPMVTLQQLTSDLPNICQRFDVAYVDVYGSVARGDAEENSDLDLIVEFTEPRRRDLAKRFFGFLHAIEDRYQARVDILTEGSLKNPHFVNAIRKERVRVYG